MTVRPLSIALDAAEAVRARQAQFELAHVVRYLGLARLDNNVDEAIRQAEAANAPPRVVAVLKAAAAGAGLASDLAGDWRATTAAFLASLRDVGIVDALLSSGVNAPWIGRSLVLQSISGGTVAEGGGKPIRELAAAPATLIERKAAAIVVMSAELFREAGPSGVQAINDELRRGVVATSDASAMTILLAGVSPTASVGTIIGDVHTLLAALDRDSASRIVFAVGSAVRDALDALPAADLPEALRRWPVIRSDQVTADSMLAINASSIVASDGGLALDTAAETSLQMDGDPTQDALSPPVPSNTVSMWQTNAIALRAERLYKLAKARAGTVAAISGIDWLGSTSP